MASVVWNGAAVVSLQQQHAVRASGHAAISQGDADGHCIVGICGTRGSLLGQQFKSQGVPLLNIDSGRQFVTSFSSEFALARCEGVQDPKFGAGRALSSSAFVARWLAPGSLASNEQLRSRWSSGSPAVGLRHQGAREAVNSCGLATHIARATAQVQEGAADSRPTSGVSVYNPASYDILVSDATRAVGYALDDKKLRMEVDFPPLPSSVSGYKGSSDEFLDANVQLAFSLARKLKETKGLSSRLVFPDGPEKRRALRVFKSALEFSDFVSFGSLEDLPADKKGVARGFFGAIRGILDLDFEEDNTGQEGSTPDVYIVVGASTSELPGVKEYIDCFAKDSPVILFNLETDTLRADLGLFGFPSKDVHYKFLTQFQPVFYIRTRDYSKSVRVAPFILNYSGALFRQYPGPWQVMLKQNDGSYVCVAENTQRYTLFQTKEELLISLGLQEEAGSTMAFLRSGYKTSTWWEDTLEPEESQAWRT